MWINNQLSVKGSALILSILQKHFVNLQFNRLFHILAKRIVDLVIYQWNRY